MSGLNTADFIIGYAFTAMPIRLAVERGEWEDAAKVVSREGVPPHVADKKLLFSYAPDWCASLKRFFSLRSSD